MKVIHFIPSAFEYFEDIRSSAFGVVEELDKLGAHSEIITLQYGSPSAHQRTTAAEQDIGRVYKGTVPNPALFNLLSDFDIIHFHVPLLGFIGKFLKWRRNNPTAKVVLSYYRPVKLTDAASLFVLWYNTYYLPRLARQIDGIIYFSKKELEPSAAKMKQTTLVLDGTKFATTSPSSELIQVQKSEELGEAIIALYAQLLYT